MKLCGFEYDMASNGKEAVDYAIANEGKYDLCLMDIDIPVLNGLEAIKNNPSQTEILPYYGIDG